MKNTINIAILKTFLIKILIVIIALYIIAGAIFLIQWVTCSDIGGGRRVVCESIDIWTKMAVCLAGILFVGCLVFFIKLEMSEEDSSQRSSLNLKNWPWK